MLLNDKSPVERKRLFPSNSSIKHIFEDGELDENSVVRFFRTTATDGKQCDDRMIKVASLPAVSLSGNRDKG